MFTLPRCKSFKSGVRKRRTANREVESVNRKNVRGAYPDVDNRSHYQPGTLARSQTVTTERRKRVPPEQTHAENYYYKKQMESKTLMAIVMNDGEVLRGTIEWYDKNCIKLHRNGEPNLLVFKRAIKYLYKEEPYREELQKEEPLDESMPES